MKAVTFFLSLLFSLLFLGCGSDCSDSACDNQDQQSSGIKILAAAACGTDATINGDAILKKIASLNVKIKDKSGKEIFNKSFSAKDVASKMSIGGIDGIENATVVISGFINAAGTSPDWLGKATNVKLATGQSTSLDIMLYPLTTVACFPTGITPRFGHTATQLQDGRILIAGGFTTFDTNTFTANKSVEIIDPETGSVETLLDLTESRAFHIAVALSDGSVLIAGGVKELKIGTKQKVEGYPDMPFTLSAPAGGIEIVMPNYPKANMVKNKIGKVIANKVEQIDLANADKFYPFQSYAFSYTDDPTSATGYKGGTIFMAGGVKDGKPVKNYYGLEITEGATVSVVVNEYVPGDNEASVWPLMAGADSKTAVMAGGKKNNASSFAQTLSASKIDNWGTSGPLNIMFGTMISDKTTTYSFGGAGIKSDGTAFVEDSKVIKYTPEKKQIETGKLFNNGAFNDAVYAKNRGGTGGMFAVFGGTDNLSTFSASNIIQFIHQKDLIFSQDDDSYDYLNFERIMHKVVMNEDDIVFVTGGITALSATGNMIGAIEIKAVR